MIETAHLSLGQAQRLFVLLENRWVAWCLEQHGWALTHGEGCLNKIGAALMGRKALLMGTDQPVMVADNVHHPLSLHYHGLAQDWNLFVNDIYIDRTESPHWVAAGEKAEELGLSWGGRFSDGNHISLAWGGMR